MNKSDDPDVLQEVVSPEETDLTKSNQMISHLGCKTVFSSFISSKNVALRSPKDAFGNNIKSPQEHIDCSKMMSIHEA